MSAGAVNISFNGRTITIDGSDSGGNSIGALVRNTNNFYTIYGDIIDDYNKLKYLYDNILSTDISNLTQKYINAQFEEFNTELRTTENLVNVVLDISKNNFIPDNFSDITKTQIFDTLSTDPIRSEYYDENLISKYKQNTYNTINTLQQAGTELIKIANLEAENAELKTYKEILEDSQLLSDYLKEMQETTALFSTEAILDSNIELKEWYKIYLERFGPPGDGIFDSEKLANIIQELIDDPTNDITEDIIIN